MELPSFALHRSDLMWTRRGRTLVAHAPDVTFTAQSAWYSSRWIIVGVSALMLPLDDSLYVSRAGGAHGYWRNAPPGLAGYFGYCDASALMPLLVGERTRTALKQHDTPPWSDPPVEDTRQPVALHIHARSIETTTVTADNDRAVVDDQQAIHTALADDHAAMLDAWNDAADQLRGTIATAWPPLLTVPRAHGSTTIALEWPASPAAGCEASIELSADARGAKLWSLEREPRSTPNSIAIADREFLVMGDIPIAMDALQRIVARADILSIIVRRNVTIRIGRSTPDVGMLDALLELIGELCGAKSEPYR
ncbi:MAG TPA: hypothetical protein VIV40_12380 [Kofleriaceae bacterium]